MLNKSSQTVSYGSLGSIKEDALIVKKPTSKFGSKCKAIAIVALIGLILTANYFNANSNISISHIISDIFRADDTTTAYIIAEICDVDNAGDLNNDDTYYITVTTADGSSDATAITGDRSTGGFIAQQITVPGQEITSVTFDASSADDSLCINSIIAYIGEEALGQTVSTPIWISNNCDNVNLSPCSETYTFSDLDNTCSDIDTDTSATEYVVALKIADQQYAGTTAALSIELKGVNQQTSGTLSLNGGTELERGGFYAFGLSSAVSLGPEIITATISFPSSSENAVLISQIDVAPVAYPGSSTFTLNSYWLDANGEGANGCDATFESYGCMQSVTLTLGCTPDVINYQYVATTADSTYDVARAECISKGGDLAIFSTSDEYATIYSLCETKIVSTSNTACYLGYNDLGYNVGDFRTINGEPLSDTFMDSYLSPSIDPNDSWDRCGCISTRFEYGQNLDDCTCNWSSGVPGICQIPISS